MKRIYLTSIPLDSNFPLEGAPFHPVNFTSQYNKDTVLFPIVPIISDTLEPGEEGIVLAIHQANAPESENWEKFQAELGALGKDNLTVVDPKFEERQDKDLLVSLFETITDQLQDDACYYADITFGTKTYPMVMMSALSYAENILENCTIKGLYYQEVRREYNKELGRSVNREANLYDVTSIYLMNSIIGTVAGAPAAERKKLIHLLLNPLGGLNS